MLWRYIETNIVNILQQDASVLLIWTLCLETELKNKQHVECRLKTFCFAEIVFQIRLLVMYLKDTL